MINLTGLDKREFILNDDHIEKIQSVPETVITLSNGRRYMVSESIDEIKEKIINYKRKIFVNGNQEA